MSDEMSKINKRLGQNESILVNWEVHIYNTCAKSRLFYFSKLN